MPPRFSNHVFFGGGAGATVATGGGVGRGAAGTGETAEAAWGAAGEPPQEAITRRKSGEIRANVFTGRSYHRAAEMKTSAVFQGGGLTVAAGEISRDSAPFTFEG